MSLIMSFSVSKEVREGWEDGVGVGPLCFLTVKRPSEERSRYRDGHSQTRR
jgi:hypothetical protein